MAFCRTLTGRKTNAIIKKKLPGRLAVNHKVAIVLESIATAILFLIFHKTWILALGLGLIYWGVHAVLLDDHDDDIKAMSVITVVSCIITALVRIIFSGVYGINLFYLMASFSNGLMCGGMSIAFMNDGYESLDRRTVIRNEYDAARYLRSRKAEADGNMIFFVINMILFCALALPGLFGGVLAFSPLLYVAIRILYVNVRAKFR